MEGDGELSWQHNRDYRQGESVMGPSSLSAKISPEALGSSLPNITGSQASSIKVTLNGLIGSHTYECESICVCARERQIEAKLRNAVLVSKYVNKCLCSFGFPSLLISVTFTGPLCYFCDVCWKMIHIFFFF